MVNVIKTDTSSNSHILRANLTRIFFVSLGMCVFVLFVILIACMDARAEVPGLLTVVSWIYLASCVGFALLSRVLLRLKEPVSSKLPFRLFWILYCVYFFYLIYADMLLNGSFLSYGVFSLVLILVPLFSPMEQAYFFFTQVVFAVILLIKTGTGLSGIACVCIYNALLFAASRVYYQKTAENQSLKERLSSYSGTVSRDPLTGFYNRSGLEKMAAPIIDEAARKKRTMSLLLVDIDDLCSINTFYGTQNGDLFIKEIGGIIRTTSARSTDLICRMIGGRFIVLLNGNSPKECLALAERIRGAVEAAHIPTGRNSCNPYVTVSIGVSTIIPEDADALSYLIDDAYEALLDGKRDGKNNVTCTDDFVSVQLHFV